MITGNAGNSVSDTSAAGTTNAYNTASGMLASTTGNITGIYDMSGAAEYSAAYINNGNSNLTTYSSNLINAEAKYKDVYSATATDGISDTQAGNYALASSKYGDAVWETSSSGNGSTSWFSDHSTFQFTTDPLFSRGGSSGLTTSAGIFAFGYYTGEGRSIYSFRVVLIP